MLSPMPLFHLPPSMLRINLTGLFFLLLLSCKAAIKVRRQFNDRYTANLDAAEGSSTSSGQLPSPARQLMETLKKQQKGEKDVKVVDAHCWIRIERKTGEFYEENGSCSRLSRGVYACQSKTFVDPFNPFCMFMD